MIGVKAALLLLATTLGVQGQTPGNGTTPTGPHCVRGATYCGYILLHDKDYTSDQIVKAYCQGRDKCDSEGVPKDKDAWKYTLFVCLPDGKIHKHKLNRRHGNFDCTDSVDTQVVPLAYCKPPKGASGLADDDICLNPKENRIGRCWEPGNLD
ncbi:hypothetical protein MGG_04859 [Pyricularia oryzae 70-15]|uniref:Secreted protein n=2 Tax=Pyricularia oryzae TaxID=318829 RepID=G4N2C0_PYRO7|nr:uncharacterized protein MGG_04859 [Pyricularia oryzae 70-15]EHA52532.1 hypothetical protein MGG_04859 [Pyricularia oryzae 70-15]KAI7913916.1 hypothetical protein M0657_009787 [Pyricularia oryzae]KAI7923386.1 hypothetical protein M9X92_004378 [Pyricularia oryzae]